MALNFPSSPSENDSYSYGDKTWTYDGNVWLLNRSSLPIQTRVISSTPPTTPFPGQIWTNSDTGKSYTYLDDGSSSQWVEELTGSYFDNSDIPLQSNNSGKYLTTDGSNLSWGSLSVTPTAVSDQVNESTGYLMIPVGTTAERPVSAANGMIRFNTTTGNPEWYFAGTSNWYNFSATSSYDIDYLVVAGGGAGGNYGGGGGAGGYIAVNQYAVSSGESFAVTVGAGGAGRAIGSGTTKGSDGTNSSFGALSVAVGGGGGGGNDPATALVHSGASGGSGGGASNQNATGTAGSGTTGQGNSGGLASGSTTSNRGGGGGGASAAGAAGSSSGSGGAGTQWLNGSYYAGGGGGGGSSLTNSVGGVGGGGNYGSPGAANTGGGGGSGNDNATTNRNGGSGIVIIRYVGSQRGSGGNVTSSGGYTYHTFTSSGTYTA